MSQLEKKKKYSTTGVIGGSSVGMPFVGAAANYNEINVTIKGS
jgi:hypothetical protein